MWPRDTTLIALAGLRPTTHRLRTKAGVARGTQLLAKAVDRTVSAEWTLLEAERRCIVELT